VESGFFAGFLDWLLALVHHWELVVVTGAIPFVIDLVDKIWGWKMPKKVYVGFVAMGLFLAMFATWRDEHARANSCGDEITNLNKKLDDLTKPDFDISAPQSAFNYDAKSDQTWIFLVVGITNRGAPSVAGNWKLEIESPGLSKTVRFNQLPPDQKGPHLEGKFSDEDSIYEKMMRKPLERGAAVAGWAFFKVPGKEAFKALDNGTAVMHLIFCDYRNTEHKSAAIHVYTEPATPDYFPTVKGGFHVRPGNPKQP
jgi:hypothetical protein